MGMSENEIYPPAKHFYWEDDENIIGIGGTILSGKFTYIHMLLSSGESREHFGAIWPPDSKFETGSQPVGATN